MRGSPYDDEPRPANQSKRQSLALNSGLDGRKQNGAETAIRVAQRICHNDQDEHVSASTESSSMAILYVLSR
jgi:hypothetical protein